MQFPRRHGLSRVNVSARVEQRSFSLLDSVLLLLHRCCCSPSKILNCTCCFTVIILFPKAHFSIQFGHIIHQQSFHHFWLQLQNQRTESLVRIIRLIFDCFTLRYSFLVSIEHPRFRCTVFTSFGYLQLTHSFFPVVTSFWDSTTSTLTN